MDHHRQGAGKPLLLVHGLGGTRRSWDPIVPALAAGRELILVDLPGHGATPAEDDSGTFAGLARSLEAWLDAQGLAQVDMVGSSMGARLVLEMARRGKAGAVVSLDPGGFWAGGERHWTFATLRASGAALRLARPLLPTLAHTAAGRTALLAQLSARPWALDGDFVERELKGIVATPTFDALVADLAYGPPQEGPAHPDAGPITIGWGSHDRLCFPSQAIRAQRAFPSARLHALGGSGHFPMWDEPEKTAALIARAAA